ncbi:beta-lactamase/transpeptidase-like protein [Xylariomycetidae sp. FL0641]|nr:beta-lactamase/transpeptidase-like protein [Xylariomycetidae sp. FL0641]
MDHFGSPNFRRHVEQCMEEHRVPGLSIAIAQDNEIFSAGYGQASLDPDKPCTADTLFDIASSSKSLTAASVALLVDDNETYPAVQWDTPMSTLLPDDFVLSGTGYTEGVTVEDILSHRSGMPSHDDSYYNMRAEEPDNARSITRNLRNLPIEAPIRSKYIYCNMMYTVATHLIEEKTKQTFSDFLDRRFFGPLAMDSTCLQPGSARDKGFGDRIATGYEWDKSTSAYRGFQAPDCPEAQGAGSIVSSANDFIKWVKALMNREGPLNEKTYRGLTRMRTITNPYAKRLKPFTSPSFYAAGLEVWYFRGHTVIGHNGLISGFASRFFFLPDFNFGAVILGNSAGAGPVSTTLMRRLIEEVVKVPDAERSYRDKIFPPSNSVIRPKPKKEKSGQLSAKSERSYSWRNSKTRSTISISKTAPPQETPLELYTGVYSHPGYHYMEVEIKDNKLYIDATDRSMGFTVTFEHVSDQRKYTAHLSDYLDGGDDPVDAEFVFEDDRVVKMGIHLEPSMKDKIWFEKLEES